MKKQHGDRGSEGEAGEVVAPVTAPVVVVPEMAEAVIEYDLSKFFLSGDAELASSLGASSGFAFAKSDQEKIAQVIAKMVSENRKLSGVRLDTLETNTRHVGYSPLKNALLKAIEAAPVGVKVKLSTDNQAPIIRIRSKYRKLGRVAIFCLE